MADKTESTSSSGISRPSASSKIVRPSASSGNTRPSASSGNTRPSASSGNTRPSASSSTESELKSQLEAAEEKNKTLTSRLKAAEERIKTLTTQVSTLETNNTQLSNSLTSANTERAKAQAQLKTVQSQLQTYMEKCTNLTKEKNDLQKKLEGDSGLAELLEETTNKYETVQAQYDLLRKQVEGSFASDELAAYFNNAIVSFNQQMKETETNVQYRVNSMDVDLKAQISKSGDELRFLTRGEDGTSAVSTVKISIAAVPKT